VAVRSVPGLDAEGDTSELDGTIFVLLPVHNRRSLTVRFVAQLRDQTDRGFRLVLIDDGSTDGSASAVEEIIPETVVLRGNGNLWWGGSLQRGYEWIRDRRPSGRDLVLIVNDDTQIESAFLATGRRILSEHERSLVLAQLHDESDALEEVGARVDWRSLQFHGVLDPAAVNVFSTRGLFLRATDFVALGGFHPRLLPHYASDYEFTIRAAKRGYSLRSDPTLSLRHGSPGASGRPGRMGALAYLRTHLSRRSRSNPVYWMAFLALACPPRHIPKAFVRVWGRFVRDLLLAVVR
jgi:GT2 family glycosyltransferase